MCLAIPRRILEMVDEPNRLAKVDVAGVRRTVNIGLFDGDEAIEPGDWVLIHVGFAISKIDEDGVGVQPGDWVLIHVGFALSKVDEEEARATRDLLQRMGADYEQELEELKASVIE